MAERAVVDTVGVTLAAGREETVKAISRSYRGRLPAGPCRVLTGGLLPAGTTTQAAQAALLNGTAAHALDYDDVADSMKGHPSAVLVPTALAVGEEVGASGTAVLGAICAGFQIECALADGLGIESHYSRGWHSTSTIGTVAAAAIASRLLGSSPATTRCALGIAGSMAAGSRQNFGTMTKPLHAGLAASNGILAAVLAGSGLTADPDQLEAPLGYFSLYGGEPFHAERLEETLWGEWAIVARGLNVKRYPSCYDTARTADAALWIALKLRPEQISEVSITLEPGGLRPLIHHRPQTGLEGKFSLEFVAATALLDGKISLATFTDESVRRPAVRELISRIRIGEQRVPPLGGPEWTQSYSVVRAVDRSGAVVECRRDDPLGHARRPLSEAELAEKFADCLVHAGQDLDTSALFHKLRNLRSHPSVRDLGDLLATTDYSGQGGS
jgi:2-methylcitrate dehydratase PrpD